MSHSRRPLHLYPDLFRIPLLCVVAAIVASCGGSTSTKTGTAGALAIKTSSLPSGTVGVAYSTTLSASGGITPYRWSVTGGSLPVGLSLTASTGVIAGTPMTAVTAASVTLTVADGVSPPQTQSAILTLTIAATPPTTLAISSTSLPGGTVGAAYSATLVATGGTAPYNWSVTSGALPAGLTLAPATGLISGTPTAAVTNASSGFTVTDSGSPAQTHSVTLTVTVTAAGSGTLVITTTSLPSGYVGTAYGTTLMATGGTPPYSWSIAGGSLPVGLSLTAATGSVAGTPSMAVTTSPIGVTVTDSGNPAKTASTTFDLTIASAIAVTMTPLRAGLTVTEPLALSATTNDAAGVTWHISPSGGSFSASSSGSGATVTLTAPTTAGVYVVSATSVTDSTKVASIVVGVTDLTGVFTYHNNLNRDGANTQEYALTTANVTSGSFGKLFSCPVDGAIYTQPLWVANQTVNGAQHNVILVATQHDGLYAFDADANPCMQLWHVSLIDTAHGGASGESSVPYNLVGSGYGDISPEVGVTGTPVIDPSTHILYVVSKSVDSTQSVFSQRLHAIDITTGAEKAGSPLNITGTADGTGDGGTTVAFSAKQELQRAGLALANGTVYVTWSSHEDAAPYYGWVVGYTYNGTALTQVSIFNVDPNDQEGGIWMGGGAPAVDPLGNLYLLTGNGTFDVTDGTAPNNDYGDSMLKLTPTAPTLTVAQYFTPTDQLSDQQGDHDFGGGGAAILANLPVSSPVAHLILGGGKDGSLYVLNRDMLGGSGDANAWQQIAFGHGIFSTGAFWNNNFYLRGTNAPLESYLLNVSTAMFSAGPVSTTSYGFPGSSPSVSASSATSNGIVWDIDDHLYCTHQSKGCGPAVLHAFVATNVATELWNSSTNPSDAAGNSVKFSVPTVANGKVYVGTRGNDIGGAEGSATIPGELDVYGLTPN